MKGLPLCKVLPVFVAAMLAVIPAAPQASVGRPREDNDRKPVMMVPVSDALAAEGKAALEAFGMAGPAAAPVDTFCIVWYDFETMDWQGWTTVDMTAQPDTFFHVDDFAGLDGGTFGRLVPIEGTKSAWCGTREWQGFYGGGTDPAYPGYGNGWDQVLVSDPFAFKSPLTLSFHGMFDTEEGYDYAVVEYDAGGGWAKWSDETFEGVMDDVSVLTTMSAQFATKIRFRFISDGFHSDQDGFHDTDGACIIDSITVSDDNGLIHFEDFESAGVGALDTDFWRGRPAHGGFGSYSGLAANLLDRDPCGKNFSSQIVFFIGSPWMSDDYPGMPVTPYCMDPDVDFYACQHECALSPVIDMSRYSSGCDEVQDVDIPAAMLPDLGGAIVRYTAYLDLPSYHNLVFYYWMVRSVIDGVPGMWMDRGAPFLGGGTGEYYQISLDVSDLVGPHPIQIGLFVADWCDFFSYGRDPCVDHTPAPYFDNVRVYRYETAGPQWFVWNMNLFQDTFPQDDSEMESFCRADMANDVAPGDEFGRIDPGDSAVVSCAAPLYASAEHPTGLDTLVTGENRVYFHCNVHFLGPDGKPDLTGPQLEGTYGSWLSTDGGGWDIFLCGPALTSAGTIASDRYCIDLNDSLFTRGYMVEYYFKAYALGGVATMYPHDAEEPGGDRYEFTCLPTLRSVPGVLYCDDYHNRGTFEGLVQHYMEPALEAALPEGVPFDKYDTNGPSSGVSNGIGAYVSASSDTLVFCEAYLMVVHDSGDLASLTISDGSYYSDKSNDARLLVDWMNNSGHMTGLLVMGDNVASDLSRSSAPVATELARTICGVYAEAGDYYINSSYYDLTGGRDAGGIVNPLITGVAGGPYDGLEYYADGGCPTVNDFDVMEVTGPGQYALRYPDYNSTAYYAGIFTDQLSASSQPLRTVWVGHSIMNMRNAENGVLARNEFMKRTLELFETGSAVDWTDTEIPAATTLAGNFPNPFNPATRIDFSLSRRSHVKLRIYDVAGRLVRALVDETRDAGPYSTVWNGKTENGHTAASGVYFCRMEAPGYERTLKMVLLR